MTAERMLTYVGGGSAKFLGSARSSSRPYTQSMAASRAVACALSGCPARRALPASPSSRHHRSRVGSGTHGLSHLPPTYDDRLAAAARRLTVLGLHRIAQAVTIFAATRTHDSDEAVERAWIDAYLRLEVALDLN